MANGPLILIVDEVPELVRLLQLELQFEGFRTTVVILEEDVIGRAIDVKPDAIIMGSVIPTPHVFELLTSLRDHVGVPIVFVNTSGNDGDSAIALELGAAEVMNRPFLPDDLVLRLHALLDEEFAKSSVIKRGTLQIDVLHRIVFRDDTKLNLATNEWALLLALAGSDEKITAGDLLVSVWGDDYAHDLRFLDVWIKRLRTNLNDDPANPTLVLGDMEQGFWLAR